MSVAAAVDLGLAVVRRRQERANAGLGWENKSTYATVGQAAEVALGHGGGGKGEGTEDGCEELHRDGWLRLDGSCVSRGRDCWQEDAVDVDVDVRRC